MYILATLKLIKAYQTQDLTVDDRVGSTAARAGVKIFALLLAELTFVETAARLW